jgi:lipid II:glycine glycyltransferase (peptidoglycan interpeptide bridge formation enzyme)
MPSVSAQEWDAFLAAQTNPHVLQSRAWGDLKSRFGWRVLRVIRDGCGAQVLLRSLPLGFTIAYIPRGPVGDPGGWEKLWAELDGLCHRERSVFLKVEPDLWEDGNSRLQAPAAFQQSKHTIQPRSTILVDLQGDPEGWMMRMKQKTRYNIRLAGRKDVVVSSSDDVTLFHKLMLETGDRDGFGVHSQEYYRTAYQLFKPDGNCELFFAHYDRQPLAALMVFSFGKRAWYLFGASTDAHRERMPAYLLQWQAMLWAAERGCTCYDMYGVPDEDESVLEDQFLKRSDGLWGVYRFKRGFGGNLARSLGAWDRVYNKIGYLLYTFWSERRNEAL